MPFGQPNNEDYRSQQEAVNDITARPALVTESIDLPGLDEILNLTEEELNEFFKTVLKFRGTVVALELELGNYDYKEVPARIPGCNNLHDKSFKDTAKIITQCLMSDPNCIGINMSIEQSHDQPISKVLIRIGSQAPTGPHYDNGRKVEGDEEFAPKLLITYPPRA